MRRPVFFGSPQYFLKILGEHVYIWEQGKRPIFPPHSIAILDEAHKLPETARQMFGVMLTAGQIQELIEELQNAKYLLATGTAWEGIDFPGDCVSLLIIPRLP